MTNNQEIAVPRTSKNRVMWTEQLQIRFLSAIENQGVDAIPTTILKEMNVTGLTRENVASHLQKFRKQQKAKETQTKKNPKVLNLPLLPRSLQDQYQSVIDPPKIQKKIQKKSHYSKRKTQKQEKHPSRLFSVENTTKLLKPQIQTQSSMINTQNLNSYSKEYALSSSVCEAKFNSSQPFLIPVTYSYQYKYPVIGPRKLFSM